MSMEGSTPSADDADAAGLPNRLLRKAETAIQGRTSRILCVVERCTDEHNYSAVIRTAEALGVQHIWLVDPVVKGGLGDDGGGGDDVPLTHGGITGHQHTADGGTPGGSRVEETGRRGKRKGFGHGRAWREAHKLFARRANEFTTIREFDTTAACVAALREDGRTIWATDLSQHAVCMTETALRAAAEKTNSSSASSTSVVPEKLAIVFGTESVGCTEEMLTAADMRVYLPLRGFADSLNLSVAAALVMHELFHLCPEAVGAMSEEERAGLREKWFTQLAAARVMTHAEAKRAKDVQNNLAKIRKRKDATAGRISAADAEALVAKEAALEAEAAAIEEAKWAAAKKAVEPHLAHPPAVLRDMRRPDEHREAFVGPKVRARNEKHWAGMAAIAHNPGLPTGDNGMIRAQLRATTGKRPADSEADAERA